MKPHERLGVEPEMGGLWSGSFALKAVLTVFVSGVAAFAVPGAPAYAEIEVTKSSVPNLSVGTKLPDDGRFDIPGGAGITVIKKPEGTTHTLKGPFRGTLPEYLAQDACSWWQRAAGLCKSGSTSQGTVSRGATASKKGPEGDAGKEEAAPK